MGNAKVMNVFVHSIHCSVGYMFSGEKCYVVGNGFGVMHRIEVLISALAFLLVFWQMSIATDKKVQTVICFDRLARVLFGCYADEFFDFAKLHPFAGMLYFICNCHLLLIVFA